MAYAQTNYPQIQGIYAPGKRMYTIAEIGCFITSFCNLLGRKGRPVDPLTLNNYFRDRGIYVDVDDGIRDDVGWDTITKYDPNLVVTNTGSGVPPHSDAIVKFSYTSSRTGNFTTHFCLVNDRNAGTILDSWDGAVKSWNGYGGPKAWATYEYKQAAQPGGSAVNDKFTNEQEVKPFYVTLRGNEATVEERKGWIGRPKIEFITSANTATEARNNAAERSRIPDLERQIRELNEQLKNRPTNPTSAATPIQVKGGRLLEAVQEALK